MHPIHDRLNDGNLFKRYGYKIYRNSTDSYEKLRASFANYIAARMSEYAGQKVSPFNLSDYHLVLDEYKIDHHDFISKIGRKVPSADLDLEYIDQVLNFAKLEFSTQFKIFRSTIEFRVVRPNIDDNNDLHRDHWFPYFIPLVNVYIPLASSLNDSAMCIVPFSHDWSDEEVTPTFTYEEAKQGKKHVKNGIAYSVPTIKNSQKELKLHRPDIVEGDFMLFSPKLVHGGGTNSSLGTRFSFEIRLEEES